MEVVVAPKLLLSGELRGPGWVQLEGATVVASGWGEPPHAATVELPRGALVPGLIDLQLNGAFGHDLATTDLAGWREVVRRLPATGVTAFVPTFITAPLEELARSLERYRRVRDDLDAEPGARTLGVHCEGPFLAAGRHGAHRRDLLCDPTPERVETLLAAADGQLAYLTLAPELPGGLPAVDRLVRAGVRVAVGHSDATDQHVTAAVDAGVSMITHLFNAQRPLHHRDPGVVGAALADPRVTVGLIVDLHHVAPTAVRVAFAAAGERIALVTDAVSAMGMPPGVHELGGEPTTVRAGAPPVRDDGTLAGSVLRLDEAVANAVHCGVDPAVALTAASRVPADALGRSDLGRLTPGARADVAWLDDDWRAAATWIDGRLAHVDEHRASDVHGLRPFPERP